MTQNYTAKAYLKIGCPFSFKFLMFMTEAGLLTKIDVIELEADSQASESLRQYLVEKTGKPATFPTVEIQDGVFKSDSDELISLYADQFDISPSSLPTYQFYLKSVLPKMTSMFGKLKAMNAI